MFYSSRNDWGEISHKFSDLHIGSQKKLLLILAFQVQTNKRPTWFCHDFLWFLIFSAKLEILQYQLMWLHLQLTNQRSFRVNEAILASAEKCRKKTWNHKNSSENQVGLLFVWSWNAKIRNNIFWVPHLISDILRPISPQNPFFDPWRIKHLL